MAAKKAKTPPRKVLKEPPRKPLGRITLQRRSLESGLDDPGAEGLELGPELDPDADFDPRDAYQQVEEAEYEDLSTGIDPGTSDDPNLPPLTSRPTRRASKHTIFPDPGSFKLTWDAGRLYWKKLWDDPRTRPRLRVYIYRWFPAMLEGHRQVVRLDGDAPDSKPDKQAQPLSISEMLHRYGVGDYGFKINDAGAGNQQVCQFALTERSDMRDWENYPPILDMDGLDLSDPINSTYIKEMKSRKKWGSEEEKEENMAALEKVEKLYERMLEDKTKQRPRDDDGKAADVAVHGAKAVIDLVVDNARRFQPSPSGGGTAETMTMVTALVELVKGMKGENQLEIITTVMQRAAEAERAAHQAQVQGLTQRFDQLMDVVRQQQANPSNSQAKEEDDPLDRYRKMIEMKEIMGDLFDKGSAGRASRDPWYVQYMPVLVPVLSNLGAGLGQFFSAMAANRAGTTLPVAPNPALPRPIPSPGMQGGAQVSSGTGGAGAPGQPAPQDINQFLEQLRHPLLRFLNEGRSGFDFADLFIEWFGQDAYDQISSQTPLAIMQFLASYAPLWGDLAPRQQQVHQFLEEFVTEPPPEDGMDAQPMAPNGALHSQAGDVIDGQTKVPGPRPVGTPIGSTAGAEKKTGKRPRT